MEACGDIPVENSLTTSTDISNGPGASGPVLCPNQPSQQESPQEKLLKTLHQPPSGDTIKRPKEDGSASANKDDGVLQTPEKSSQLVLRENKAKNEVEPKEPEQVSKRFRPKRLFWEDKPEDTNAPSAAAAQDTRENDESSGPSHSPLTCVYNPNVSDISSPESGTDNVKRRKLDPLQMSPKTGERNTCATTPTASRNSGPLTTDESSLAVVRTAMLGQLSLRKRAHLGSASCSHVVLCECECSHRNQAVVKFYPKDSKGFDREVAALKRLRHPGIIRMISCTSNPDQKAIVLRYCPYGNLASQIGQLSFLSVVRFFYKISSALHYIHQKGIIHGDIKLENILVNAEYNPQISDFDLAVQLPPGGSYIRGRRGTTGYIAPEMVKEPTCLFNGYKTDSYGLGAVLLCMLFEIKLKKHYDLYYITKHSQWPKFPIARQLRHILKRLVTNASERRWDVNRTFGHLRRHPEVFRLYLDDSDREDLDMQVRWMTGNQCSSNSKDKL